MASPPPTQLKVAKFMANVSGDNRIPASDREAFARKAVSASYYACYHIALEWAELRGYKKPKNWGHHDGLWGCWYTKDPDTDDIRQAGEALKKKRVDADYFCSGSFAHNAHEAVEEAQEFFELIGEDVKRVKALPKHLQKRPWKVTGHIKPKPPKSPKPGPGK